MLFSSYSFHIPLSKRQTPPAPIWKKKNSRISGSIVRAMVSRILSGISDVPKRFSNILYLIRTNSCLRMLPYCRLQMSRQYEINCFLSSFISIEFSVQRVLAICPNKCRASGSIWISKCVACKGNVVWTQRRCLLRLCRIFIRGDEQYHALYSCYQL